MVIGGRMRRDRRGNVTVLTAGALTMILSAGALGIDAGSLYLAKRRLQGTADAAALAALSGGPGAAHQAIAANGSGATIDALTRGSFSPDATLAPETRFVPGSARGNAVRIVLGEEAPLFLARAFLGRSTTPIVAQATAARVDMAAFSIGSRLAGLQGGALNALLSALAGTELTFALADYRALAGAQIDVLDFADALRGELRLQGATYGEVLAADARLPQAVRALAAATPDPTARMLLFALAVRLPATPLPLAALLDLGPLAPGVDRGTRGAIAIDALATLAAMVEIAGGERQVAADVGSGIPGLAGVRVTIAIGERAQRSPWLAVASDGSVVVRTAQIRTLFEAKVGALLPTGPAVLHVPIVAEFARAEATLASVRCHGRAPDSASLDVLPSIGWAALAAPATFADPTGSVVPATLVSTPPTHVTGEALFRVGGVQPQTVAFDAGDIAERRVKTVSTRDATRGIAASLLSGAQIRVHLLGFAAGTDAVSAALGTALAGAAPALDVLIADTTALLGVGLGQADVQVNGVRCGIPTLVG